MGADEADSAGVLFSAESRRHTEVVAKEPAGDFTVAGRSIRFEAQAHSAAVASHPADLRDSKTGASSVRRRSPSFPNPPSAR